MRKQFKDTLLDLAAADPNVVVVVGDISHYLFNPFQERFPDRFYNLGICEQALISVTAGLAAQGFHPFAHSITPFITERCLEQLKVDVCYNGFGVNVVSCGATFDYAWDGATHHAYGELAALRLIPGMDVLQPGSRKELDALIRARYRSGRGTYYRLSDNPHEIDAGASYGKAAVLKDGAAAVTVMTAGPILANVLEGCRDLPVNVVYFNTIKPIDREAVSKFRRSKILVVHDAHGLHEAVCEVPDLSVAYHGLRDEFYGGYGTVHDARRASGLDPASIRAAVRARLGEAA